MFIALSRSACLVIVPDDVKRAPEHLAYVIDKHEVTVMQVTPALFKQFTNCFITNKLLCRDSKLRVLAFGGEECPNFAAIANWKHQENRTRIFNLYGITEVSSWATCYEVTNEDLERFRQGNAMKISSTSCIDVPLGSALTDTVLEVRKGETKIMNGEGEMWIGRMICMILLYIELEIVYL
jgi:acyl-CoA synthetase